MDSRGRRGGLCGVPINLFLSPSLFINGGAALGGNVDGGEGGEGQRRSDLVSCDSHQRGYQDSTANKDSSPKVRQSIASGSREGEPHERSDDVKKTDYERKKRNTENVGKSLPCEEKHTQKRSILWSYKCPGNPHVRYFKSQSKKSCTRLCTKRH